jgi:hypothetical protein
MRKIYLTVLTLSTDRDLLRKEFLGGQKTGVAPSTDKQRGEEKYTE